MGSQAHNQVNKKQKPTLCVDFDGVIHSYKSGWEGVTVIPDLPVPGALQWLCEALIYFTIAIYSSRSKDIEGVKAMRAWLEHHARASGELTNAQADRLLKEIVFAHEKPAAFLTVDDRAIQFQGNWNALDPERLLEFKPWYQR